MLWQKKAFVIYECSLNRNLVKKDNKVIDQVRNDSQNCGVWHILNYFFIKKLNELKD